jgi:hypothetical protein
MQPTGPGRGGGTGSRACKAAAGGRAGSKEAAKEAGKAAAAAKAKKGPLKSHGTLLSGLESRDGPEEGTEMQNTECHSYPGPGQGLFGAGVRNEL